MLVIIAMVPLGAILGLFGGLLIEIVVGLIARAALSAEHPATFPGISSARFRVLVPSSVPSWCRSCTSEAAAEA
jgi:hypothetical protein